MYKEAERLCAFDSEETTLLNILHSQGYILYTHLGEDLKLVQDSVTAFFFDVSWTVPDLSFRGT